MRVLNVVDGPGWTGGVEQALLLTREMRNRGIDAHLAAHGANRVLVEAREHSIPAYAYEGPGKQSLASVVSKGFDVAIGHKPAALRALLPHKLLRRRKKPLLLGVRRVSFDVNYINTYRFPDHVIAVGGSVRDVLVRCGLRSDFISVIPSGVDLSRFFPDAGVRREERARRGLRDDEILIVNLAKFVPAQKGQDVLFKAVKNLRARLPVRLLLAGIHTDGDHARQMAGEAGLTEITDLAGFRRDIPQILNAADVFVFPSLPGLDAIAGSVLQAMACEKIVVSTAIGSIPEYLRDGENGFLVPPGNPDALEAALARAASLTPIERNSMGKKARQTVMDRYSVDAMTGSYLELIANKFNLRRELA